MTAREFVEDLYYEGHDVDERKTTVEECEESLKNFERDGWDIPEDLTAELFCEIWNELVEA